MRVLRGQSGATLVETLVAIALVSVVLTAVVGMVVSAVATSTLSKSRTTATRLAEEGIEVARKTRDRTDWDSFYNAYVNSNSWKVDLVAGDIILNTSGSSLPTAPFTRTVTFSNASVPVGGRDRVQVISTVTWNDKGKIQEVKLVSFLTKWRK